MAGGAEGCHDVRGQRPGRGQDHKEIHQWRGDIFFGRHVIKSWSSTQRVIALSSGEAELYALVRGAAQTKGLVSMLADFGVRAGAIVCSDSSAAIGISHRKGLGKTRHIQVQDLWIQEELMKKRMQVKKIGTHQTPADMMTKSVAHDILIRHTESMDLHIGNSRAATALELKCIIRRPHSTELVREGV